MIDTFSINVTLFIELNISEAKATFFAFFLFILRLTWLFVVKYAILGIVYDRFVLDLNWGKASATI